MTLGGGRLRVAQIIDSMTGSEREVPILATRDMRRFGIDTVVVCGSGSSDGGFVTPERTVTVPHLGSRAMSASDTLAFLWIAQWIRMVGPDVVQTVSGRFSALTRLAAASAGVPVVHTAHRWGPRRIERYLARRTDSLVVPGAMQYSEGIDASIGVADQYRLVATGVSLPPAVPTATDRRRMRRSLGLSARHVVGVIAPFDQATEHELAVRAFAKTTASGCMLVLVGEGPTRRSVQDLVDALDIRQRVRILPGRATDNGHVVGCLDLTLVVGQREGLTDAARRSAAAGVPVLAVDRGNVGDLVAQGRTGTVLQSPTPAELAEAIEGCLSAEGRIAGHRMAASAFDEVQRFSAEIMQARMADIWRAAASRGAPAVQGTALTEAARP